MSETKPLERQQRVSISQGYLWQNNFGNEKFIHVKFALGEKKFVFPDAFLMGFLEL